MRVDVRLHNTHTLKGLSHARSLLCAQRAQMRVDVRLHNTHTLMGYVPCKPRSSAWSAPDCMSLAAYALRHASSARAWTSRHMHSVLHELAQPLGLLPCIPRPILDGT